MAGIWATERTRATWRIEQCGDNLCGYAVKSNERILINMKRLIQVDRPHPRSDSGRNYDSTMVMRRPERTAGQGCAWAACSAAARPGSALVKEF